MESTEKESYLKTLNLTEEAWLRICSVYLKKKGVVACGIGFKKKEGKETGELSIIITVEKKLPENQLSKKDIIPKTINGIQTDIQEGGKIEAHWSRTDKWRPAPGGASIGHPKVTAGTLGCLVRRGKDVFILSNNHVLANSNDAQIGDPILQPGKYDGGTLNDIIAKLEDFVPIRFKCQEPSCPIAGSVIKLLNLIAKIIGSRHRFLTRKISEETNFVDAAIARPIDETMVIKRILEVGEPAGVADAQVGTEIKKSGRTTGLTFGKIKQACVAVIINYDGSKTALFVDQLIAGGDMSAGGDSGSAVLDNNNNIIGLLFAGSPEMTIINPIARVFEPLNVKIA